MGLMQGAMAVAAHGGLQRERGVKSHWEPPPALTDKTG